LSRNVIYTEAADWPKDEVEANLAYLETRGRMWELEQAKAALGVSGDAPPAGDGVPDGTVDEVLAWVGSDKARAQKALDAEDEAEKPRTTLVEALEAMVEAE
jgi:hypothetical protein